MDQAWDITFFRNVRGWAFKPHSGKADGFLWREFGAIPADRDLTLADCFNIVAHAGSLGLRVRDLTREG